MRNHFVVVAVCLLFSAGVIARDGILKSGTGGTVTTSGTLNTSSVPYKLVINPGTGKEEVVFVENINASDAFLYDDIPVTVTGKSSTYQGRQHLINVETIRKATEAELKKLR